MVKSGFSAWEGSAGLAGLSYWARAVPARTKIESMSKNPFRIEYLLSAQWMGRVSSMIRCRDFNPHLRAAARPYVRARIRHLNARWEASRGIARPLGDFQLTTIIN